MNSSSRSEKSNYSSGGKSQSSVISIQIANEDDDNVVIQLFPNKKTVRRNDKKKSRHKMKRQAAGGNSCSCKSTSKKGNAKSDVSSNGCCSMYSNIYRTAFGPTIDETLLVGFETLKNLYVDDCNDSVLAEHGSITQDDEADQKRTGSEPEIESEYTSASTRPYVRDPQRRVLGRANADDTPTSKLMKKGSEEESKRPLSRGRSRRRSRSESSSSVGRPVSDSDTKSDKTRTSDKIVPSESSAEKDHTTDKIYHKKRKSLDHVEVDQIFPDDSDRTGPKKSSISTEAATVEDQKDRGIERSPRVSGKFAVLYPITDGVKRYSEKGVQKDMLSPKISNGSEKEYIVIDPLVVEQAIAMKRKSVKEDSKEDYLIIDPASIKQALSISKKSVDDVEKDTPDVPRKSRSSRDRHDSIDLNKQENGSRKNSVGIDQIRQSEDVKKNGSRTRVSEEGYIIIDPAVLEQEVKRTELQKVFKDSGERRDSTDSRKESSGSPRRSRSSRNNSHVLEDGDMKKKSIRESINNGKRQESDSQSKRESLGSPRGSKVSKHDSKESAEKMVINRHSVDSQTKKDSLSKPRKSEDLQILEEDDDIRKDSLNIPRKTGDSLKGFIIVDPEIIAEAVALRKTLRTSNVSENKYSSNGNEVLRGSSGKRRVSTEGSTSIQVEDIPKKRESVEDGNDEIIGKKKEDYLSNLRKSRLSKDGYIVIDSDTFKRDSRDERKRSSTEKNGQNGTSEILRGSRKESYNNSTGRNSSTSRKSRASRDSKDTVRKELEIIPEDSDTKTDEEAVPNEIIKDFRKNSSIRGKSTSNNRGSLNDGKNGVRVNKDDNKDDTVEKLAVKIENKIQGNNDTDDKSESTSYSDESTESDDYSESGDSDEYSPDSDEKKPKDKNKDKPLSADSDYKSQSTANNNRRESRGSPKDSVNNMTDEREVRNTILEDDPEKTKYSPEELKKLNKYVEITESEKRTKEFSPFDTKNEPYTGYFTVEHKRPNIKLYRYIYDSDSCAGRKIRVPYSSNTCRSMSTSKESNQNDLKVVEECVYKRKPVPNWQRKQSYPTAYFVKNATKKHQNFHFTSTDSTSCDDFSCQDSSFEMTGASCTDESDIESSGVSSEKPVIFPSGQTYLPTNLRKKRHSAGGRASSYAPRGSRRSRYSSYGSSANIPRYSSRDSSIYGSSMNIPRGSSRYSSVYDTSSDEDEDYYDDEEYYDDEYEEEDEYGEDSKPMDWLYTGDNNTWTYPPSGPYTCYLDFPPTPMPNRGKNYCAIIQDGSSCARPQQYCFGEQKGQIRPGQYIVIKAADNALSESSFCPAQKTPICKKILLKRPSNPTCKPNCRDENEVYVLEEDTTSESTPDNFCKIEYTEDEEVPIIIKKVRRPQYRIEYIDEEETVCPNVIRVPVERSTCPRKKAARQTKYIYEDVCSGRDEPLCKKRKVTPCSREYMDSERELRTINFKPAPCTPLNYCNPSCVEEEEDDFYVPPPCPYSSPYQYTSPFPCTSHQPHTCTSHLSRAKTPPCQIPSPNAKALPCSPPSICQKSPPCSIPPHSTPIYNEKPVNECVGVQAAVCATPLIETCTQIPTPETCPCILYSVDTQTEECCKTVQVQGPTCGPGSCKGAYVTACNCRRDTPPTPPKDEYQMRYTYEYLDDVKKNPRASSLRDPSIDDYRRYSTRDSSFDNYYKKKATSVTEDSSYSDNEKNNIIDTYRRYSPIAQRRDTPMPILKEDSSFDEHDEHDEYDRESSFDDYRRESSPDDYRRELSIDDYQQELSSFDDRRKSSFDDYRRESSFDDYRRDSSFDNRKRDSSVDYRQDSSDDYKRDSSFDDYRRDSSFDDYRRYSSYDDYSSDLSYDDYRRSSSYDYRRESSYDEQRKPSSVEKKKGQDIKNVQEIYSRTEYEDGKDKKKDPSAGDTKKESSFNVRKDSSYIYRKYSYDGEEPKKESRKDPSYDYKRDSYYDYRRYSSYDEINNTVDEKKQTQFDNNKEKREVSGFDRSKSLTDPTVIVSVPKAKEAKSRSVTNHEKVVASRTDAIPSTSREYGFKYKESKRKIEKEPEPRIDEQRSEPTRTKPREWAEVKPMPRPKPIPPSTATPESAEVRIEKKQSGNIRQPSPPPTKPVSRPPSRPASPPEHHGDVEVSRNRSSCPRETRYAITRVTKYDDFTTYEVMKSTKLKPRYVPCSTEGVFIVKNKNKNKGALRNNLSKPCTPDKSCLNSSNPRCATKHREVAKCTRTLTPNCSPRCPAEQDINPCCRSK